jgi:hypothetical protein
MQAAGRKQVAESFFRAIYFRPFILAKKRLKTLRQFGFIKAKNKFSLQGRELLGKLYYQVLGWRLKRVFPAFGFRERQWRW